MHANEKPRSRPRWSPHRSGMGARARPLAAILLSTACLAGMLVVSSLAPSLATAQPDEAASAVDATAAGAEATEQADAGAAATEYDQEALSREGFVPAEDQTGEAVPGGTFLLAAYIALIAILFGYIVLLARRSVRLRRELDEVSERLLDSEERLDELERS